jgi:flagellar basal body-associated protein FliL
MVSFQNMIREIIKWVVYIIMLLGVLALVGAGILWAMGSDSEEYTKKAKWWAKNIIIGLVLLFTFRYILGFLAPWIFQ